MHVYCDEERGRTRPSNIPCTTHLMNTQSAPHLISASALAVPLAVLLLASINALLENGGQAARNAVTIAKSALCAAALSLAAVLVAEPFQLVLMTFGGLTLSLSLGPLPVSLLLSVCFTSLLLAKETTVHEAAGSVKDSIARWNIAVLFTACAMILSGSLIFAAVGCVIAVAGLLKAHAAIPGILPVLTNGRMKPLA